MIRLAWMNNQWYGLTIAKGEDLEDNEQAAQEIQMFVDEGTPVLLVDELDAVKPLGFDPDEVTMCDDE